MQYSRIYKAKASNYSELIDLWEQSVKATHHFLSDRDIEHYKVLIHDYYFDELDLYFITENDGAVGFIGLKYDFIQLLFVSPAKMGQGVGKILVEYVITEYQAKTVDVNEQNIDATGFYQKMGFEITDRSAMDAAGKPFPVLSLTYKQKTTAIALSL